MPSSSFLRTRNACEMISGPMPSPGRTATFILEVPGKLRLAPRLEGANFLGMARRQADLIQAVPQAVLAERVDVEAHDRRVVVRRHRLLFQIGDQFEAGEGGGLVEKPV